MDNDSRYLKSRVPICLVNYEDLPYLELDRRYQNPFYGFEDIYQWILFAKFHKNLALPAEVGLDF